MQTAKKYFNCTNITGVELEEFGGLSAHWESRILLGEYMNIEFYLEEQVISEFTLALLEDTGYYKANYYTGGLMRYGKNKGCDFLNKKCVNNYEINPYFENEFYYSIYSNYNIDSSCSSGRQSRTYYTFWNYEYSIPYYYRYFKNDKIGGLNNADYCPVSRNHYDEEKYGFYVGKCSTYGLGDYGTQFFYSNNNKKIYYKSSEILGVTGEIYSNISFCYQSSLIKKSEVYYLFLSKNFRAICMRLFVLLNL